MSKSSSWEAWEQALKVKGCSESCWVRNLSLPDEQEDALPDARRGPPLVDEKIREAAAAKLYQNIRPWQTRILRIEPATQFDKPILCTLLAADVIAYEGLGVVEEDGPKEISYEALSYTWGAPVFSFPIRINRIQFFITENLDSALRHLRLSDSNRYLWVDALCINQFDNKEKSIQVGRMLSVYKKARRVVAWNSGWSAEHSTVLSTVLANISDSQKHSEDCLVRFKRLYQFLVKACEAPLFRRTWVRQEAFAARDMVMQFSDLQISWAEYERIRGFITQIRKHADVKDEPSTPDFTDVIYLKSPFSAIMTLVQPEYVNDSKLRNGRDQLVVNAPVSLLDALVFSSYFGVTDPRDLVYGILGFTTVPISQTGMEKGQPTLKIDYGRSVSEVYQDVVKYEIARTESLDILDFAASHPTPSDIPSWTPDWRTYDPQLAQHRVLNKTNLWKHGFIDVKRVGIPWKPIPQSPDANGVLLTKGIMLGMLHENIDDTTAWRPFISPSFESGFKERFGGRSFDDTGLFPGVSRDYRSAFDDEILKDGNLPLHEGKVAGVKVAKAGIRLMTLLQSGMLSKIKHDLRGRVIVPPEPIRGNHVIGCASSDISLAPKGFHENDIIVLFQGSQCPFVLRRSSPGKHVLIGRAIFPFWFEHKSSSFDELRMEELAWSSRNGSYTQSDILESSLKWPEKMASIWGPVLRDAEFLNSLEDFQLV